jgi:hypothetical protein
MPPFTRPQPAQQQAADPHPDDLDHWQPNLGPGFTNLALATLAQDDPQPGALAKWLLKAHVSRLGAIAIFEHHSAPPGLELLFVGTRSYQNAVLLFVLVTRVRQAVGQVAVVGEQDQPFTVDIQAPYRIEMPGGIHHGTHRRPRVWPANG